MRSQALSGFVNSSSLLSCHTLMTHLCFAQLTQHKSFVPTCEKCILWIWKDNHWNYPLTSHLMSNDKLIEHVQCTEMFYFWDLQILIRKEKDTRKVQTQKTKNSIKSIKSKEKPHMYAFKLINNKIEIVWRVSKGVIKDLIKCYCLICLPKRIKVAVMHLGEFFLLLISTSTDLLQIKRYVSVNSGLVQGIFTNKKICECG